VLVALGGELEGGRELMFGAYLIAFIFGHLFRLFRFAAGLVLVEFVIKLFLLFFIHPYLFLIEKIVISLKAGMLSL
jgi:hypothetical protein